MEFERGQFTPRKKHHKWPWITLLIIVIIILLVGLFFHLAKRPQLVERHQTIQYAQKYAGLHNVNNYYYSNLNDTYYSVGGLNKFNQYSYAIMSKNHDDIQVITQKNGISPEKADRIAKTKGSTKILNTALSLTDKKPVWVVTSINKNNSLNYVTINFKDGKIIQTLKNI